jgi:hypothetical protein
MTKALTPVNQNNDREIDPIAERFIARESDAHFPSYFGNFGISNPFLMLRAEPRQPKRRLGKEREFPLITAFVAIV